MSIVKKLEKIEIALKHLESLETPTEADLQLIIYLKQLLEVLQAVDSKYKDVVKEYLGYCESNQLIPYTEGHQQLNTSEEDISLGVGMAAGAPDLLGPLNISSDVVEDVGAVLGAEEAFFINPEEL